MIVSISALRGHEFPEMGKVRELEGDIEDIGVLLKPIAVDRNTMVILDGHCRCAALRRLGCSKVAVKFVDYSLDDIIVESWDGKRVTKNQVIEAGLSGSLMMPKSSRHMVMMGRRRVHISEICKTSSVLLGDLR